VVFGGTAPRIPLCRHGPGDAVGAERGVPSPGGFVPHGGAGRCHPLPGLCGKREKTRPPVSKPPAPRVPPMSPAPSRGPPAQHWLQGPPPRRGSRDSVVPVGVGGVTTMEGTRRCFWPGGASGVLWPPSPLLTHVLTPAEMGRGPRRGGGQVWGCGVPRLAALLRAGSTPYDPPENPQPPQLLPTLGFGVSDTGAGPPAMSRSL